MSPLYDPRGEILAETEAKGSASIVGQASDTLPASYHGFVIERKWIGQLEADGTVHAWVALKPESSEAHAICRKAGAPRVLGRSGELSPETAANARDDPIGTIAEQVFTQAYVAAAIEIRRWRVGE